jgi:predicted  nucleic acid-binding Zn-ribbon protein
MNDIQKFLDHDLDLQSQRMKTLEEMVVQLQEQNVAMQEQITSLMFSMRDTQRYLIKLAQNQQDITKRVSMWPYLTISNEDES